MSTIPVSTEGRIFVRKMILNVRAQERAGADCLSPGARTWDDAFLAFAHSLKGLGGPVRAGKAYAAARERVSKAMREHDACFVNYFLNRKRSGMFEVLTWQVAKHPIHPTTYDGVIVRGYRCILHRRGVIEVGTSRVAYIEWHALGRLYERTSNATVHTAGCLVGMLGIAGMVMRESKQHLNNAINVAFEDNVLCTGVLRYTDAGTFYDCRTVLPADHPKYAAQFEQGRWVAAAVSAYLDADIADPRGYGDKVPVMPIARDDYVTSHLRLKRAAKAE